MSSALTAAGPEEECLRLERQLELAPDDFDGWLQLARLRNVAQQAAAALQASSNALTLRPSSLEALYERGLSLLGMGMPEAAVSVFASLLALQPLHPSVLISLGRAFYELRSFEQAGKIWEQAVRVASNPLEVLEDLAVCYYRLGDFEKVAEVWERVLRQHPSHPQALHHLAALGRRPVPERSANDYLVKHFDEFAVEFDATLGMLGYDGPRLLAELVENHPAPVPRPWHILDLGCGTGLCAAHLRPWAVRLEGVDLSPGMLEKARARGLYDALHCEEMSRFCELHPVSFDLLVAGDSMNYSGDLEPLIQSAARSLRPGGRWAFFVERANNECPRGFRLERHGRYVHQTDYVVQALSASQLRAVALTEATIRSEAGHPVQASFFLVER